MSKNLIKIKNYINGTLINPVNDKYIENVTPVSGEVYSLIPDSDHRDIDLAVEAAKNAFIKWKKLTKKQRFDHLMRLSNEIQNHFVELVMAESKDNGKPEWLAEKVDIPRVSENFKFFATASLHFASEVHEMDGEAINYTLRQPIGVVGCISPWNLPLYLLTWKIAPALASGNTVIAKPSEVTPMTAYIFSKICQKINFPKGVINIVHGSGNKAGEALSKHIDVPVISFTGGTDTGKRISTITAPLFKKISLELGGKNPTIIFDDADFNITVDFATRAAFSNQGQICLCGSRIFIQKGSYKKYKEAILEKTKQLTVGDPSTDVDLGAVVSKSHMNKILKYIDLAKSEGGKIIAGGKRLLLKGKLKNGFYIQPTIIEGLSYNCRLNNEEIFGPVVTLIPFENEKDLIEMVNSTKYGLSASIFTQDISLANRTAYSVDAGIIWINTWMLRDLRIPFGGVKNSGVGREGGFKSLDFFTEPKNVCVKI